MSKLTVDWEAFGQAIRANAVVEAKRLNKIQHELGLSHTRMVNAAQGKPVGVEIFLTICHWLRVDPMHFTRGGKSHA